MADTGVVGGALGIRQREGQKWHRLVDFATADKYARSHGRRREARDKISGNSVVLCGQPIHRNLALEQKVFEDAPSEDACRKCWRA